MNKNYLFPNRCKYIGKIIAIPSMLLGVVLLSDTKILGIDPWEWLGGHSDEVVVIGSIIGLTFAAFSKEKTEDEYITYMRSVSLIRAVIINYIIIIAGTFLISGTDYLTFVFANMISVLLLYILKFNFMLYRFKHYNKNEQ